MGSFSSLFSNNQEISQSISSEEESFHSLKKVHLIESARQDKEWEMTAERARNKPGGNEWHLFKVEVFFYHHQRLALKVFGNEALFDSGKRYLKINGDVKVETQNGYQIKTESLFYDSQEKVLFNNEPVQLLRGGGLQKKEAIVNGGFLRTSLKENDMLIGGNVLVDQKEGSQLNLKVIAGEARFSKFKNQVEFFNNVKIEWGEYFFESGSSEFHYDEKEQLLYLIKMIKNVKIISPENYATCGQATLSIQEEKTELLDSPRIIQGKNQLEGDKIILNHRDNSIRIDKMRAIYDEEK